VKGARNNNNKKDANHLVLAHGALALQILDLLPRPVIKAIKTKL
jgi:hypothetical protein